MSLLVVHTGVVQTQKHTFLPHACPRQDIVVPFSAKASEASGTHFSRLRIFYIYKEGTLIGHFDPYTSRAAPAGTRLTNFSPLTGLKSKNFMAIKVFEPG